jgi:hypothetical protein
MPRFAYPREVRVVIGAGVGVGMANTIPMPSLVLNFEI